MEFRHSSRDFGIQNLEVSTTAKGRKYTTPEGKQYPSITTVLGHGNKEWLQQWRDRVGAAEADKISRFAANRGTELHDCLEKYLDNETVPKMMPMAQSGFNKISRYLDKYLGEIWAQEVPLYSDYLRLAGRVDLIAELNGSVAIIDFKTSRKIKKKEWIEDYFLQMTAYSIMWEERTGIPISKLVIVMDIDYQAPRVFIEKRDNWAKKLITRIRDYENDIKELSV
jgi:CRISPR/Cas system-associated exonuclease Cas4 (RecB family)